ncbi:hypothetical protein SAMN05216428_11540 [Nitrosospira sp. Nsp11]|uniref:hypothetical protein n=1 Tax=Nitrosospira sp. Nsp11 TaxID=1855338 RepID=UPI00091D7560|nr:hypothetical protein [Nitrosospira sp. Nsp11]SHM14580.1 hypothetical protein SAMN05216428_11540 [Nitrosospira sp. Nsp11]
MPLHKLDLKENALDSFNEALVKYREGQAGNIKAYKFAILHFSHFLELLFKLYVSQAHPLLIYKNPFSKNIAKEQTIGLWEAVQFLKNEGKPLDGKFIVDLEWLKTLRNGIEHHKFEMEIASARRTLGRLVQAMNEFSAEFADFKMEDWITEPNLEIFQLLADEYKADVTHAQDEARERAGDGEVYDCGLCGERNTAVCVLGNYICHYCEDEDKLIICCICGAEGKRSEAIMWNDDVSPTDYACVSCVVRIENMN